MFLKYYNNSGIEIEILYFCQKYFINDTANFGKISSKAAFSKKSFAALRAKASGQNYFIKKDYG